MQIQHLSIKSKADLQNSKKNITVYLCSFFNLKIRIDLRNVKKILTVIRKYMPYARAMMIYHTDWEHVKRLHLMLVRMDIQLHSHLVTSKENEIYDALSRGDILKYHSALEAWKTRGESADT